MTFIKLKIEHISKFCFPFLGRLPREQGCSLARRGIWSLGRPCLFLEAEVA